MSAAVVGQMASTLLVALRWTRSMMDLIQSTNLAQDVRQWSIALGFADLRIADAQLDGAHEQLQQWLDAGFHGEMDYMAAHGVRRARPAELVPGTVRVISVRMDYLPQQTDADWREHETRRLSDPEAAVVSVYARGRDYHKVMRSRLQQLADKIAAAIGPFGYRVFTDSAPVMEVEIARRAGMGWRGKHTLLLNREAGSMFFLGEIYVDLALPVTPAVDGHCGSCNACIDVCPTQAIVAPYQLDARRCISYLTIEHDGVIPVEFRAAMGNRIYGCDDCQLVCPWNKYAQRSALSDFDVRAPLGEATLLELWRWSEADFLRHTEGSAIRRIGHARWQRNLAVAMGNALRSDLAIELAALIRQALASARDGAGDVLREHIDWALAQ